MDNNNPDRLQKDLEELKGIVTSVVLSAKFREDVPFEAFMAQHGIAGERRTAVQLVLGSVLARAAGGSPQQVSNSEILDRFPVLRDAQASGSIDVAEAIRILGAILGNQVTAYGLLDAHRRSGFGKEGYERLGFPPQQGHSVE